MNKTAKRIIAGVSAAVMFVSAVGVGTFTNSFMKTSYADSSSTKGKNGKSTGFSNLEQDTDKDNNYYNTGYGLHTNKTAKAADDTTDGRTFDVDLESWYVGENPVDVATILDASGSMAWTVDTLDPLEIDPDSKEIDGIESKYGKINNIDDLITLQNKNGGYLPQDVVDCILDKTETDDSKLSYAGYKYYVYEDRSSVSEFVPLGYWDGGIDKEVSDLMIGCYDFNNNITNQISGKDASYIKNVSDGELFSSTPLEPVPENARYSDANKGIDLVKTANEAPILLDVEPKGEFTISFDLYPKFDFKSDTPTYDDTPLIYIGGIEENAPYYEIYRGNKSATGTGTGASTRLRIMDENKNNLTPDKKNDDYNVETTSNSDGEYKKLLQDGAKSNNYIHFDVTFSDGKITIKNTNAKTNNGTYIFSATDPASNLYDLKENLRIIIGGNAIGAESLSQNYIKKVVVKDSDGTEIGNYSLDSSAESALKNTVSTEGKSAVVINPSKSSNFDLTPKTKDVSAVYADNSDDANYALNLTQTSKEGAVLLDAAPSSSNFTISFKVKRAADDSPTSEANILYMGNMDTNNDYYRIFRGKEGNASRLRMTNKAEESNKYVNINLAFNKDKYQIVTLVFEDTKITQYVDGSPYEDISQLRDDLPSAIDPKGLSLILGGLFDDSYNGTDIYIDDLHIYDTALTEKQVESIYGESATSKKQTDCKLWHAVTEGNQAIAQIDGKLSQSPASLRRGWYYVNSHSKWEDIKGCLESGKQYVGIVKESDKPENPDEGERTYSHKDVATMPGSYTDDEKKTITDGDNDHADYDPPTTERSIRFYVDDQNHLRCFAFAGGTSKKDDPRTFCSVVYEKQDKQITKYEQLNSALNQFYENLAEHSDLTNSAIVRFSTNNVVGNDTTTTSENLKMLVIKDWTNWSDEYIRDKNLKKDKYLENLLIPTDKETSIDTTESTSRGGFWEYPYVMTGGTYTWTGLKAFYDNMVDTAKLKSGDKVYDIANDARDKYLIIFTDGRDNLVGDTNSKKYIHKKETSGDYKNSIGNYAPTNSKGEQRTDLKLDSQLAKAWADKLKEEGYTIYCVMMATGSISPTANTDEYNKAHDFLTTLAGSEGETNPENYVIVADPSSKGNTTVEAFQEILTQIQQPRKDYTVQDYIDPRFDLIDKSGEIYHLGAGGKITKSDGIEIKTVGNVIKELDKKPGEDESYYKSLGLEYTPQDSFMVNRSAKSGGGYTDGDGVGTGYIYYDDEKDMYYLRWTDQIIPMENKTFDTDKDGKEHNVWSATIRLKAKDDFIGGNDILTNGNEAGENLVYSDATIENMDKGDNYKLYGFEDDDLDATSKKIPYRKKLEALSGTNRKINAVDAGGVSQAVYGNGIDIPSSGFPRVVVDVRLKPLDAKDLNDVIYMGEVISPTMMLADLENGYMTGSYYLEYLARYAYRLYGYEAAKTPLLELLNQWLKINEEAEAEKTFTIPYMYLPEPIYNDDGTLKIIDGNVVAVKNSTGMSTILSDGYTIAAFEDSNLCDVTGFITYTWKREDPQEAQQYKEEVAGKAQYDITKEYVVKNTNQIKYNLQLKFTPLKDKELTGFTLDNHFIKPDSAGKGGEKFFKIDPATNEFAFTGVTEWSVSDNRTAYLKAMVSETKTYEPHVMYNKDGGKWVLVDNSKTGFSSEDAVKAYTEADKTEQTTANSDEKTVTDKGVYDWDSDYKEVAGTEQIEKVNINDYYTGTPKNVQLVDAKGNAVTDETGKIIGSSAPCSIVANTTYVKDVVNGALALELVVNGKYLSSGSPITASDKTYTFEATRYYDDPIDPLPYGSSTVNMNADTGILGKKYRLTFDVEPDSIPKAPESDVLYTVWAKLSKVEELDGTAYKEITESGYKEIDALPIGTYVISVNDTDMSSLDTGNQYYIGYNDGNVYFKYLKLDNASSSYTYNRFPDSVYDVSSDAAKDTSDNEYLINNAEVDYAPKNIADCSRTRDSAEKTQELTFYFGTVEKREVNGTNLTNTKGENRIENQDEDYAKDRLGIIMLSVDPNSLAISKKVTNTKGNEYDNQEWTFNIDFTLNDDEAEFKTNNDAGFKLTWYKLDAASGDWVVNTDPPTGYLESITFKPKAGGSPNEYTATIALKHGEKVVINGLPEGTWQVKEEENRDLFYSPHNNAHGLGDGEWEYERADATSPNIQLNPASHVDFVNEFPYELPSAGGIGVDQFIFFGTVATVTVALTVIASYYKRRKRRRIN